jgi:catechol 2,3-dioxygenase-like lactoylglutathione lyase family enzyme
MAVVRYLVNSVDEALPFYRALGFRLVDRWGPPFAVMKGSGLSLWLSGPGTSARKKLKSGALPEPGGWNRLVVQVRDLDATLARLQALGVAHRSPPLTGPGGRQVLVDDPSGNPVELFQARDAD